MAITNVKKNVVEMIKRNEAYPVVYYNSTASEEVSGFNALASLDSTNDADVYVTSTGAYGVSFEIPDRDDKYLLLLKTRATSDKTVYVKKGDNPSWGAGADLEITVKRGNTGTASTSTISSYGTEAITALTIDSAQYGMWKAENPRKKQIVIVGADNTVSVCLIKLP